NAEDVLQAEKFVKQGNVQLTKGNWADKMQKLILPLTKEYQVEFDKSLVKEIKNTTPEIKLQLQKRGDYLVFQPMFTYNGIETKATGNNNITIPEADKILVIQRNREAEEAFINK